MASLNYKKSADLTFLWPKAPGKSSRKIPFWQPLFAKTVGLVEMTKTSAFAGN
jgi:hypothetical protein